MQLVIFSSTKIKQLKTTFDKFVRISEGTRERTISASPLESLPAAMVGTECLGGGVRCARNDGRTISASPVEELPL